MLLLLAAALFWEQPVDTAAALRQAGIERLYVPPAQVEAWKRAGFDTQAFEARGLAKVPPPGVQYRMNVASATREPWIDANGWRFLRDPAKSYYCEVPRGRAALAAAESAAYGVQETLRIDPADLERFGRMLGFLRQIERPPMPALANIGVVDDGSAAMGEVMNLLSRRNLLFRIARPQEKFDAMVRSAAGQNPSEQAQQTRSEVTDEKRLVRLYGTSVVLARLTGEHGRARLHLLHYGERKSGAFRVRVLGAYSQGKPAGFETPGARLLDYQVRDGATEFTIPEMSVYAVVDLLELQNQP